MARRDDLESTPNLGAVADTVPESAPKNRSQSFRTFHETRCGGGYPPGDTARHEKQFRRDASSVRRPEGIASTVVV